MRATVADQKDPLEQVKASAARGLNRRLEPLIITETFTATGAGTSHLLDDRPLKYYGLGVTETGTVTSWTVEIQVSMDDVNWTTVDDHQRAVEGDGVVVSSGTTPNPARYARLNCSAFVLGAGTSVAATAVGVP